MAQVDGDRVVQWNPGSDGGPDHRGGVPCAARPSTSFRHYDGRCECFFGGPAPEYPPALLYLTAPLSPPARLSPPAPLSPPALLAPRWEPGVAESLLAG